MKSPIMLIIRPRRPRAMVIAVSDEVPKVEEGKAETRDGRMLGPINRYVPIARYITQSNGWSLT